MIPRCQIPELIAVSADPAVVVNRQVAGAPLSWEWASGLTRSGTEQVGQHLADFLVRLRLEGLLTMLWPACAA
jgi:hypothetical protein